MTAKTKLQYAIEQEQTETESKQLVNHLIKSLQQTQNLRSSLIANKNILKNRVDQTFSPIRTSLNNIENKLLVKTDSKLFKEAYEIPLNRVEYDIHQIIEKLTNLSLMNSNDKSCMLNSIRSSVKRLDTKINELESFNRNEADKLQQTLTIEMKDLATNKIDPMQDYLENEYLNISHEYFNNKKKEVNTELEEYSDMEIIDNDDDDDIIKCDSFDFIDFNKELESIHVITDFDYANEYSFKPRINDCNRFIKLKFECSTNDGVTRILNEIFAHPMEYWLMRTQ